MGHPASKRLSGKRESIEKPAGCSGKLVLFEGFDKLESQGWVIEAPTEVKPLLIAQDYLWEVNARKSVLVVTPTHAEGQKVSARIRDLLKKDGNSVRREVYTLRNWHWSEAEKSDAEHVRERHGG